jgi:hypothetical protein
MPDQKRFHYFSNIEFHCSICASQQKRNWQQVTFTKNPVGEVTFFATCPTCGTECSNVVKDSAMAKRLFPEGAKAPNLLLLEPRVEAPPLTSDDLIDFMLRLERTPSA